MPNSSPNFSNAPTTAMQAANIGTDISAHRRFIDPHLKQFPAGRKSTKLESLRKEYIEKYSENWGRKSIDIADKEKDVKKWLGLRGLDPRGYQVFYEPGQIVGDTELRDTRGYVEHSEECGGVTLNPGWYAPARSFGEF
jgi:hypothetical protein